MFLQIDGSSVNGVAMQNVQPSGIWKLVNPLNPSAEAAPIFPGSVIQLQNQSSSQYLRANGDSPALTSDALDPTTYWTVTTEITPNT